MFIIAMYKQKIFTEHLVKFLLLFVVQVIRKGHGVEMVGGLEKGQVRHAFSRDLD